MFIYNTITSSCIQIMIPTIVEVTDGLMWPLVMMYCISSSHWTPRLSGLVFFNLIVLPTVFPLACQLTHLLINMNLSQNVWSDNLLKTLKVTTTPQTAYIRQLRKQGTLTLTPSSSLMVTEEDIADTRWVWAFKPYTLEFRRRNDVLEWFLHGAEWRGHQGTFGYYAYSTISPDWPVAVEFNHEHLCL